MKIIFIGLFCSFLFYLWFRNGRKYKSSASVASSYDSWTNDRILESFWGEHIHLGYYDLEKSFLKQDFKKAKIRFVHELIEWSGLSSLPPGSRIIDVGCGIGGSARILARDYGFDVIGITISKAQARRASELTKDGLTCRFMVMDALDLKFADGTFDGVWSVEAGPHMPNKQLYADEMLRVLKEKGVLAVADWNSRDSFENKFTNFERMIMNQLLTQWTHPEFSTIKGFQQNLLNSSFSRDSVQTSDWTKFTIQSWEDSIFEGFRKPFLFFKLGPNALLKSIREIPTILMMRWAFSKGLMQFGVFKNQK